MSEIHKTRLDEVALFRYGLIADIKDLPPGTKGIGKLLTDKASKCYCIPGSTRTSVDAETIRHWLKAYRKGGGFEGLKPKIRKDAGSSHALPERIADLLCELKEDSPSSPSSSSSASCARPASYRRRSRWQQAPCIASCRAGA